MNSLFIDGVISEAPEIRVSQGGTKYCNNLKITQASKRKGEEVNIDIPVVCFGKMAELVENAAVGDWCFVVGRIDVDEWEHKGKAYSKVQVIAQEVVTSTKAVDADYDISI